MLLKLTQQELEWVKFVGLVNLDSHNFHVTVHRIQERTENQTDFLLVINGRESGS